MDDLRCQAVISKDGEDEVICTNLPVTEIGIPDDDKVLSLLVCEECEAKLDKGEALFFCDGDLRYLIQFEGEPVDVTTG